MTKLRKLRTRLASLRRWRVLVRLVTAWSALLTALAWTAGAVFAIDYIFEMDVVQRLLVFAIGLAIMVWAFLRFTRPMLGVHESITDMALLVERQHEIPSDLVAALQFESPQAVAWGSTQLEQAVVDYVADFSRGLDVFVGFSRSQMMRRGLVMVVTLAVASAAVGSYPDHARVFANRLLLRSDHYPSATIIQTVAVNGRVVLRHERHQTRPKTAKSPESSPVSIAVICSGVLPDSATARIRSSDGQPRPLELKRQSLQERADRLTDAAQQIDEGIADSSRDLAGPWTTELTARLQIDAPELAERVQEAEGDRGVLSGVLEQLRERLSEWPGDAERRAVYVGRLARLITPVTYQLYAGDAWTDAARIEMIPLPIVEPTLSPMPPSYARQDETVTADPASRQVSVLEGSTVAVSIRCTNEKQLEQAWLTITDGREPRRFSFAPDRNDAAVWRLDVADTPFSLVKREIRFEIQVTDTDGLHLESPIRGVVRIKSDRPPTCSADIVHRVVLPSAKPTITYRAIDDYGIAELVLHTQVERDDNEPVVESDVTSGSLVDDPAEPGETEDTAKQSYRLLDRTQPVLADGLPLVGQYELDLAPLNLEKGDRLKLTLEAIDYRGELTGESYSSDPLILEVSDESGVLAAISEADERSEQRLTDIIKQQLGIGESP